MWVSRGCKSDPGKGRLGWRKTLILSVAVTLILSVAVLLAATVNVAAQPFPAPSQSNAPRTIDVMGHGDASAKPDTMLVSFVATTDAASADQSTQIHAATTKKIIDALKAKLGGDARIETSQFSLNPQYSYQNAPEAQPVAGQSLWDCKIDITAYAPSIDELGGLIDAGLAAGATAVAGSGFEFIPEEEAEAVPLPPGTIPGGRFAGRVGVGVHSIPMTGKRMPAVTLDVESQGATADEATRRAGAIADKVAKAFKQKLQGKGEVHVVQFGITRSASTGEQQRVPNPPPQARRQSGWQAQTTITARTNNLDALGLLIEAGMKAGATRLDQVMFTLSEDSTARKLAIERASEDAKSKAATLAHSMGVKLGSVLRISTNASAQPQTVYGEAMQAGFAARSMAAESMPVLPREIGYDATVNVTYQID